MLGMDQVFVVRHKVLVEGQSARDVARELGISRNTVRRYVEGAEPVRRSPARSAPVLEAVRGRLEALLEESPRWTGGKQRLTATQLHRMVVAEGHRVGATLVKEYVAEWKRQRQEVFVPLVYRPGDLGEVDFFEVLVDVAGRRRKAWMFVMRLMHSGRDFAWLYDRQDQISFLDGHVRAFEHFGAVPLRLVYDNLRPAVAKVLVGAERKLTARFQALAAHYVFEPCFARPRTGHDKGGVEARGKGIRWQHLVPIPAGASLAAISGDLVAALDRRASEHRDSERRTIAERFADEHGRMLPLPSHGFRPHAVVFASASRRSLVKVEGAVYSVPCEWAGLDVTVHVGAAEVEIVGPTGREIYPRRRFGQRSVRYRHYVRELSRKPQALRQVADELLVELGEPFASAWRLLVDEQGPKQAARAFAQVLKGLERHGERAVAERLSAALARGEPLHLALVQPATEVSVAPEGLPSSLRDVEVAAASAADFDALLGGGR
jgi:transposase